MPRAGYPTLTNIRTADPGDLPALARRDRHIAPRELEHSVRLGRVYVAEEWGNLAGWLRWNLFWDNTPFMNLLFVLDCLRGRGLGRALTEHWEGQMRQAGYGAVMTSTQAGEYAQHFYAKLGYEAVGGFLPPGEGYELIFYKKL